MKYKFPLLCIGAALLLMGSLFRPGCRIILDGAAMPGIYAPDTAASCAAAARRTAAEITRGESEDRYTLVPVLCLRQTEADEALLYHVLLESYEGVAKLYEVTVDGRPVGHLSEIGDIIALRRLYPNRKVSFTETYTYPEAESTLQEVQAVMHDVPLGPF